jgi:hypothetical protein
MMKKKIFTTLVVIAAIAALMLTAHLLVNYFDLSAIIRSVHGG